MFFFVCEYFNGLTERYPELFDNDNGSPSQSQANFGKKWKSYTTIIELANGDLQQIDKVIEEPLEKCLLFLSYKADKNYLESLMHKEAMKSIR